MSREVFGAAARWLRSPEPFALATLVGTRGGAPAALGTTLAVHADMTIAGGLGAGCYESDVVTAALETLRTGRSRFLEIDLGNDTDDPLSQASGCGSVLEIAVWRPEGDDFDQLDRIAQGRDASLLRFRYERNGTDATFLHTFAARSKLVIVGATPLANEIAAFAKRLDCRSIVVDPRPAYATRTRLPEVDEVTVAWPQDALYGLLHGDVYVVVQSHDPKIDLPALECTLSSGARYIGLLGSRRSQALRRQQLRDRGVTDAQLARIHGPVGLDLGGESVAETAISIVAEIIATIHERSGSALKNLSEPIHSPKGVLQTTPN